MDSALFALVAVVGPTGSGKSELGLRIGEEFAGEIVNCDSLQIYRHFDIGTAKLSRLEQRGRGFNIDYLQIRKSRGPSVKKTDALRRIFCGKKKRDPMTIFCLSSD